MQQVLCGAAVRRDVVADCFEPGDIAHSDGHNAATAAYKQTAHRRVTHRLAESFQRWCARLAQRGAHTFERDVQTLFAEGLEQIVECTKLECGYGVLRVRGREYNERLVCYARQHLGARQSRHLDVEK